MPDETVGLDALERQRRITLLKRKCTVKQRAFFNALPQHHYQHYTAMKALGFSPNSLWKWKRQAQFREAYDLMMDRAFDEVGINNASIVSRLNEIVERCMQARPVLDKRGEPVLVETADGNLVPAYTFDAAGAHRSLETLAKIKQLTVERHEVTGKDGEPLSAPVINIVRYDADPPGDDKPPGDDEPPTD